MLYNDRKADMNRNIVYQDSGLYFDMQHFVQNYCNVDKMYIIHVKYVTFKCIHFLPNCEPTIGLLRLLL